MRLVSQASRGFRGSLFLQEEKTRELIDRVAALAFGEGHVHREGCSSVGGRFLGASSSSRLGVQRLCPVPRSIFSPDDMSHRTQRRPFRDLTAVDHALCASLPQMQDTGANDTCSIRCP